ncbi:serine carboxypeptidase-like 35 [Canna indica]|uniref:Carboxypeptidase n=1 Tax=Canna indica TaxID=4628 RepID=A0AAQ3QPH5_9LILI|nr:serine carboxypeptidase-like 35 [Canna indica]
MQRKHYKEDLDLVVGLPGQPSIYFQHYAGYVSIDKYKSLFYWFFEAKEEPMEKPIVLWLNGGPGCSSVSHGALKEIGPFLLNNDGSPAGVGFSYSNRSKDLKHPSDRTTTRDSYAFLLKWFDKFSQYKSHEFYIAGESYAGHYVPQLAAYISLQNKRVKKSNYIHLKGIMIGNPHLEENVNNIMSVKFAWNNGIIPSNLYEAIMAECEPLLDQLNKKISAKCSELMGVFYGFMDGIDGYHIYMPICSNSTRKVHHIYYYGFIKEPRGYDPCGSSNVFVTMEATYLRRAEVQKALHANVTHIPYPYSSCSYDINVAYNISQVKTVIPSIRKLLKTGYRVWVFSGDADLAVPFEGTRHSIMKMKLTEKTWNKWGGWRAWYHKDQVAGWMIEYKEGLTFISVRGVGHMVPIYAPAASLSMFSRFLKGEPLPFNATS